MPRWKKTAKWKRNRIAEIIARDGPLCWLCNLLIKEPPKKPGRRPSIEHLTSRCQGGGDTLDNLVLCHDSCNRHLGVHPAEKKRAIREKWHHYAMRARKSKSQAA